MFVISPYRSGIRLTHVAGGPASLAVYLVILSPDACLAQPPG